MRHLASLLVALALGLVGAVPAAGVPGQLVPLPAPAGCVGFWTLTWVGCATNTELSGNAIAVSPDGRHLYVVGASGAVGVVQRDPTTGGVALDTAVAPCLVAVGGPSAACQTARAISGATGVVISPDGAFAYVSGWQSLTASTTLVASSVAIFARDPTTGALTQLPGMAGCLQRVLMPAYLAPGDETCASQPGLNRPSGLVLSPDGAFLYVVGANGAVWGFSRDAATGTLTAVNATAPLGRPSQGAAAVAISPDGAQLYVTRGQIAVVQRDAGTGVLSAPRRVARGAYSGRVAFSADGATAYVAGAPAAVTALRRAPATGALRAVTGRRGCVATGRALLRRCSRTRLPVAGVIASGRFVYGYHVTWGVSAFRAVGGGVRALPGRSGCLVTPDSRGRCANTAAGMYGPQGLVATPDGRNVYVADALVTGLSVTPSPGSRR